MPPTNKEEFIMKNKSSGIGVLGLAILGLAVFTIGTKIQRNVYTPSVTLDHLDTAFEQAKSDLRYETDMNFRLRVDTLYRQGHTHFVNGDFEKGFERMKALQEIVN